jgi:bacillithiol system protein YtxJ
MPSWWRKQKDENPKGEMREIGADANLDDLLSAENAVVFKHSTACPVSWVAHGQVTKFLSGHPEAPVFMVNVIKNRPVSQEIARRTGVVHESPQIVVIRNGQVTASMSHGEITEARLIQVSGAASAA